MSMLRHGLRNLYRDAMRAVLVVLVLGLALAVFLTMMQAEATIGEQTRKLGAQVGTALEVRRAGAMGMGFGFEALPAEFFERAKKIRNVARVEGYLFQRLIDRDKPRPIIIVIGVEPGGRLLVATHGEVGAPRIVAGRNFTPDDRGRNVALVGKAYAEMYGLILGSRHVIESRLVQPQDRARPDARIQDLPVTVVGIFETGFLFGDNQVMLPLDVAQQAFGQEGKISILSVRAASAEAVPQVEEDLLAAFGDEADVLSGRDMAATFADTLGAIRANGRVAAVVSLIAGALVVLFTMALVTRQRTSEIGTLKALGASDRQVAAQFAAEVAALVLLGGAVGLALYWLAGSALGNLILASGQTPATFVGGEDPLKTLGVRYALSLPALGLAVLAALALGLLGSFYPVARAVRMRPADALRRR
jgi:ABC-type antimicrobial peptide transport system permease subunit